MTHQDQPTSLLGEQIAKRLDQLGMSRREFSRRFNLSRQTLHALEHNPDKQFAPSTYRLIDEGLRWQAGTALAFHQGNINAREAIGELSPKDRLEHYLQAIMRQLMAMDINDLEREVLMLEEESMGRMVGEAPISMLVENRIQLLVSALMAEHLGGASKHGDQSQRVTSRHGHY